ncbi:hypothetical protein HPB50_029594 [Hyalomma asiaticum]|nr:hypothetical protein HPB50_029594 [Hyalomma asiaticum]
MALTMLSLKKDPSFGLDSRRSWVTAVFVSLCLTMALIGQHAVGIIFYGIVQTVRRQQARSIVATFTDPQFVYAGRNSGVWRPCLR